MKPTKLTSFFRGSAFALYSLNFFQVASAQKNQIDLVKLGAETFKSKGCAECHSLKNDANDVKTGPALYGLFQQKPIKHEVIDANEKHLIKVNADLKYLKLSIRVPADELAINGEFSNEEEAAEKAYLPIMPAYDKKTVTDYDIEAIWHYLKTQNDAKNAGPKKVMAKKADKQKLSAEDDFNELIAIDRPLVVRAPVKNLSARAIHVGSSNGVNYSFDPRTLAFEKFWYGGFINMTEETNARATKLTQLGKDAQILGEKVGLLRPLDKSGKVIDFSVSTPIVGDRDRIHEIVNSRKDFVDELGEVNAQFVGYKSGNETVSFYYEVEDNRISVTLEASASGEVTILVTGDLKGNQVFELGKILDDVKVTYGSVENNRWTLPRRSRLKATLTGKLSSPKNPIWRPDTVKPLDVQPVVESAIVNSDVDLLAGYMGTVITPPKDRLGRVQLFEPTAMALAKDGTVVVGTRTAGIWKMKNGQWTQFMDHTYECLGIVIEDDKGDKIVISQKPELSRVSDTDGDGRADLFETLADNFLITGNYHEYMHGPVRDAKGNYYFSLNLGHYHRSFKDVFKAGGKYMGSAGGFRGWMFKGTKRGDFKPYAQGLRSPAGLAVAPDDTIWYADNQGEYMGSSKLFKVKKDANFGHPSSAVDLPGMTPKSKELSDFSDWPNLKKWPRYKEVEKAYGIFPHSDLANAPGSPVWVPKDGKFGVLDGDMLCGDQTQSSLFEISISGSDALPQTSFTPLFNKLPSGVMRLVFDRDGSLLVGQTGRGWRALGGQDASLVRLKWDGKTTPSIITKVIGKDDSLELHMSKEFLKNVDKDALAKSMFAESYYYESSLNYGSKKLSSHRESITADDLKLSGDVLTIKLDKANYDLSQFGQRLFKVEIKDAGNYLKDHKGRANLSSFLSWTME